MNTTLKSLLIGGICGSLLVIACEKKENESKEVAQESNEAKFQGNQEDNAEFLLDAAKINLCEIKLSQLASERATDVEVKEFAKMMIDHHTKLMNETSGLAAKKGVSLLDSVTRDEVNGYNDLANQKTGIDFDRKFADLMVEEHKKAIDKFDGKKDVKDEEVLTYINAGLPQLRSHLDKAMMLQEKLKNKDKATSSRKYEKSSDRI